MCLLRNIALRVWQTDGRTDDGQSDPYVSLCFAGDTKRTTVNVVIFAGEKFRENVGKTFQVGVIFTILLIFLS